MTVSTKYPTLYKTTNVAGIDIFYREAGPEGAPTVLLLHGFPTSSNMFRNLIPALSDKFHMVAPDYPGFGNSSMPTVDEFSYTFDNLADVIIKFVQKVGLNECSLYVQDYGAPIEFRVAVKHPEKIKALKGGRNGERNIRCNWGNRKHRQSIGRDIARPWQ